MNSQTRRSIGVLMNKVVHVALMPDAYQTPERLQEAIGTLQLTGHFESLDTQYAAQIGTLNGVLPDKYISAVKELLIVQALSEEDIWTAL